jgi:hypothetical protein
VARAHRLVVGLEGLLALLDATLDDAAVDLDLEAADGRALVERELVDGLDRLRLVVPEALREDDAAGVVPDLGPRVDAHQGDARPLRAQKTARRRQCLLHDSPASPHSRPPHRSHPFFDWSRPDSRLEP